MVAALRDLQVANVRRAPEEPADARVPGDRVGDQAPRRQLGHETVQVGESEEQVDLGELLQQLLLVALDQTPDGHHRFDVALLFQLRRLEDRVDRLSLRRVDEPAGVDEDHLGVGQVGRHDRPVADQLAHEPLGIDGGLVAAEGDAAQPHPR